MPSINAYSPYETLAFFQSVARHGANASALQDISTTLKQDEHIRNNTNFDGQRFSPDALRRLHQEHTSIDNGKQAVNGDVGTEERSSKRRKLSTSSNSSGDTLLDDARMLQILVDSLYTSYKDQVVRDIKQDEETWASLQKEIQTLEQRIDTENKLQTSKHANQSTRTKAEADVEARSVEPGNQQLTSIKDAQKPQSQPTSGVSNPSSAISKQVATNDSLVVPLSNLPRQSTKSPFTGELNPSRPVSSTQQSMNSQSPAALLGQSQSPVTYPRQVPSPSPQRPSYGPTQAQTVYSPAQAPPGHLMPQIAGAQQRPNARGQQPVSQGRGSPIPYQSQHAYPPYPQYPPPPQWHPHMSPQQYQQHAAYGPPSQYYPQPSNNRHPQTPQQLPYPPYPHTAPMPYLPQQQHWRSQQWPLQSNSAVTTPISRPDSRLSTLGSRSTTPWKRRQQAHLLRPRSPPRPDREVSPLTDREESPIPKTSVKDTRREVSRKGEGEIQSKWRSRKRGRSPTVTPPAVGPSRSQSAVSRASEGHKDDRQTTSHRSQKIKAEPPSTPLPVASDTEQRSSGRRGRPRSTTVISQADSLRFTAAKRKRDSVSPTSPVHSPPSTLTAAQSRRVNQVHDSSYVIVSKNFAKTSQLLLNEITSHKLAGIFAKPLSERDAPGYKDLVLRPQDLKNIKAAVSKGNRAAFAVIETIEGDHEATPTKAQPPVSSPNVVGPIGNGFYLVPKTSELMPPKGIVNSSQLEMELVRMFANAVMFNPLQSSESGFGKGLRLRRNGGDIVANTNLEAVSVSEGSENGSSSGVDEGGIIADAREMFNDVVEVVGRWRALEVERMGSGADANASRHGSLAVPVTSNTEIGRHNSVSASSNIGDEDIAAGESEPASTPLPNVASGPGRKRRKIAEH